LATEDNEESKGCSVDCDQLIVNLRCLCFRLSNLARYIRACHAVALRERGQSAVPPISRFDASSARRSLGGGNVLTI
jgi:hypothetical protein